MSDNQQEDTFIPLCVPHIGKNESRYVQECLDTHWVSYVGSYVTRFEEDLCRITGGRYCVATISGTAALHLALQVFGVEPDTEVVMPSITFVSPANAIRYCGAWPAFIDIDPETWQIDVDKLEDFLQHHCDREATGHLVNRKTKRRIAALLPVHLLGGMADVDALAELASRFELPLIEDAAECLGATFRGRGIGAPTRNIDPSRRIVITSFNGNKIVTTGGGGALMFHDETNSRKTRHLSTTAKSDPLMFHHDMVGYNYRLSNVLAAIGVGQLELLDQYIQCKRNIAARYELGFADMPQITLAPKAQDVESTYWMYTIRAGENAHALMRHLNEHNIQARPLWVPMPDLPAFGGICYCHALDFTPILYRSAISIPCSVALTENDQDRVIHSIKNWVTVHGDCPGRP
ncbi:MAG: aminotransferase class I/II-fold pyridoxal phosphate-dependent enzyme [Pirellulales bacterium]|nr:aminotransferase class I/II-fold pyridoxal phosphate-dependent enzyme [Pirellulales bacterium]